MARPKGFEPLTPRFVVWCSIQLSYGRPREAPHIGRACNLGNDFMENSSKFLTICGNVVAPSHS